MTNSKIDDRVKELRLATARLKSEGEKLEAKIEQLKREIDRLNAQLAAIRSNYPSKIET